MRPFLVISIFFNLWSEPRTFLTHPAKRGTHFPKDVTYTPARASGFFGSSFSRRERSDDRKHVCGSQATHVLKWQQENPASCTCNRAVIDHKGSIIIYSTNFSVSGLVQIHCLILQSQLVLSKFGRSLRYWMLSMTSNIYQISTEKEPANREAPENEVGPRSSTTLVELKI